MQSEFPIKTSLYVLLFLPFSTFVVTRTRSNNKLLNRQFNILQGIQKKLAKIIFYLFKEIFHLDGNFMDEQTNF